MNAIHNETKRGKAYTNLKNIARKMKITFHLLRIKKTLKIKKMFLVNLLVKKTLLDVRKQIERSNDKA